MTRFPEILRFELVRQLRRPLVWLFVAVFFALAWLSTRDGGARADEVFSNSPIDVASYAVIVGMLSFVVAAVLAGDAAARDVQTRTDPLMYALPLGRAEYVLGRFLAACLIHALLLLVATVGLTLLPLAWEPGLAGPFHPASYARAYVVYLLPNALAAQALMFAASTATRRAIAAWGAGALLFFLSLFIPEFVGGQLGHWTFARWMDPSGYATIREYMDTWAAAQQNALQIPLAGMVVWNRIVWLSVAVATIALVIWRFRFEHHAPRVSRARVLDVDDGDAAYARAPLPGATRRFDRRGRLHQLLEVFRFSLAQVASNRATLLLIAGPFLFFLVMPEALEHIGVPLEPLTSRLVVAMRRAAIITAAVPMLVALFFTGELIWAEREARVHAMTDAAPVPDGVLMTGKLLALVPVLLVHQALLFAAAIGVQRVLGYGTDQVDLLVRFLFGFQMLDYVLFVTLAVAVHALAPHKFVGHLVLGVVWLTSHRMHLFGIEHDLMAYGAAPPWAHTDMTGYGWSTQPWLWHKLYWAGWATLLLVLARAVWPRGAESSLRARAALARRQLRRTAPLVAGVAALVLSTGGFVFWNTSVRNEHTTNHEGADRRVAYERAYGRYADTPQPLVSAMALRVELYPARGSAHIDGRYVLVNRGPAAVDSILIATSLQAVTRDVRFGRPARAAIRDARHGHELWLLERPLEPGDSVAMSFRVEHTPRGFGGRPNPILAGAAVIDYEDGDWLPRFGYQPARELIDASERRKRGLAPRAELPALGDTAARHDLSRANSTMLDVVIGTDSAHTAVAPGELRRTWSEDGRRWFHYTTDVPVRESWVILSAPYARRATSWQNVAIEVLYHPAHTAGIEHVLRSARSSLAYFSEQLGPYPFRSLRFAERPGYGGGANAHPGFVDYDESFALMDPSRDTRAIDFVFGVIAHEVAHQWWGHQLTPAYVEGAPLLTESLAWYSALGAVEREYGRAHLDRMLAMLRESYLTPRSRASEPLARTTDWFGAYRKGPFAMHALRVYVGDEAVTAALRSLLAKHTGPGAPLATSLDLHAELRAVTPDSIDHLVDDLLLANTFWDLRADSARAEPLPDGRWRVTLDVHGAKTVVDTAGVETARPLDDWIDVGVYAASLEEGERGAPLHHARHRIRNGPQRIVVVVSERPMLAAIDPDQVLIDTYGRDNFTDVTVPAD